MADDVDLYEKNGDKISEESDVNRNGATSSYEKTGIQDTTSENSVCQPSPLNPPIRPVDVSTSNENLNVSSSAAETTTKELPTTSCDVVSTEFAETQSSVDKGPSRDLNSALGGGLFRSRQKNNAAAEELCLNAVDNIREESDLENVNDAVELLPGILEEKKVLKAIIFLDLNNVQDYWKNMPKDMEWKDEIHVVFYTGTNMNYKDDKCKIYCDLKSSGQLCLIQCGETKKSIQVAITIRIALLHGKIPEDVRRIIVSRDPDFKEVQRQFQAFHPIDVITPKGDTCDKDFYKQMQYLCSSSRSGGAETTMKELPSTSCDVVSAESVETQSSADVGPSRDLDSASGGELFRLRTNDAAAKKRCLESVHIRGKNINCAVELVFRILCEILEMKGLKAIIFLDFDNLGEYFRHLPNDLEPSTARVFHFVFYGRKNNWRKKNERCPCYHELKKCGRVFLKQCGDASEAADIAIAISIALLHGKIPEHIHFIIASKDKGFLEVKNQLRGFRRQIDIMKPEGDKCEDEFYERLMPGLPGVNEKSCRIELNIECWRLCHQWRLLADPEIAVGIFHLYQHLQYHHRPPPRACKEL